MDDPAGGWYAAEEVSKRFSGVTVLDGVDFRIESGGIHALLGQNGSGKSTLIRILGGVHRPSAGNVVVDGNVTNPTTPVQASRAGLGIVHQDMNLFPDLDVATNIAIGSGAPIFRATRLVDRKRVVAKASELLERLGLRVDPRSPLRALSLAEWKLVEIARALLVDARFLILDEPTALLDRRSAQTVLATVSRLRAEGVGVALVTHRLDEALEVADRFTILRDGRRVATMERGSVEIGDVIKHIVGPEETAPREPAGRFAGAAETILSLRDVVLRPGAKPFELDVHRGEIIGLTGLAGSGALELARGLGGRSPLHGAVTVGGRALRIGSPRRAISAGIGYVPEDRTQAGIVSCRSIEENMCLASLTAVTPHGILRRRRMREIARRFADELAIQSPSLEASIATLSGGNQQKVQIGKWLASGQRILVLESPTHGVDIGARSDIHRLLQEFSASGGAVIVASTDIPDVLGLADRVAVFRNQTLTHTVGGARSSHRELLLSGVHDAKVQEIEELIEA